MCIEMLIEVLPDQRTRAANANVDSPFLQRLRSHRIPTLQTCKRPSVQTCNDEPNTLFKKPDTKLVRSLCPNVAQSWPAKKAPHVESHPAMVHTVATSHHGAPR